jgi:hypothetical protein
MITLGNGPTTFEFTLSRLVEERVKVRVKARKIAQAQALLRDREPDLEGWWETYDKSEMEVEEVEKKEP